MEHRRNDVFDQSIAEKTTTYTVTASNDTGCTATTTVQVIVIDLPIALDDTYSTDEDTVLNVNSTKGVLSNDSDPGSGALRAIVAGGPAHGTLELNPDGSFKYIPEPNYNGEDTFTYLAKVDSVTSENKATVRLNILPVNDPPVANPDSATTPEDSAITFTVTDNDADVDANLDISSVRL